jgi:hypothetical protein
VIRLRRRDDAGHGGCDTDRELAAASGGTEGRPFRGSGAIMGGFSRRVGASQAPRRIGSRSLTGCNRNTWTFVIRGRAGIELDDALHQRLDRQERDAFVEEVFSTAKLPLIRVRAQRAYSVEQLRALLAPCLDGARPGAAPTSRDVAGSAALAREEDEIV